MKRSAYYVLPVPPYNQATCYSAARDGDVDLFAKFDSLPTETNHSMRGDHLGGSRSNEKVGPTRLDTAEKGLYLMIRADTFILAATVWCEVEPPPPPVELLPGQPISLSLSEQDEYAYFHADVAAGEVADCFISGENGDADLYLEYDSLPTESDFLLPGDQIGNRASNERAGPTSPANTDRTLYVLVHADTPFTNAMLWCTIEAPPLPTLLTSDLPVTLSLLNEGDLAYFSAIVGPGQAASCSLTGNNGDGDLYVKFDSIPNPYDYLLRSDRFDTNENVGPTPTAPWQRVLYVIVRAHEPFTGATLACTVI